MNWPWAYESGKGWRDLQGRIWVELGRVRRRQEVHTRLRGSVLNNEDYLITENLNKSFLKCLGIQFCEIDWTWDAFAHQSQKLKCNHLKYVFENLPGNTRFALEVFHRHTSIRFAIYISRFEIGVVVSKRNQMNILRRGGHSRHTTPLASNWMQYFKEVPKGPFGERHPIPAQDPKRF